MSAALGLYRLQQIDSQIDSARARLESIQQALANDAELQEALSRAESAARVQNEAEKKQRTIEAETQGQRVKIEQAESSLYGGAVHNPKELQDLQRDVASLKKHLSTLEDRLLEAMLASESAASSLNEARAAQTQIEAQRGDQMRGLASEQSELLRQIDRYTSERKAALAPIPDESLTIYESLRRERRGLAVATFSDGSCNACGATLTPAQQQSARHSSQPIHCPTCGRVLFAN
ncbi:MAG: hypothetical protein HFACDABA_01227 [Anaerolineales bacterium]|nr:hypothetical protein [Anaerolineales bacterium]